MKRHWPAEIQTDNPVGPVRPYDQDRTIGELAYPRHNNPNIHVCEFHDHSQCHRLLQTWDLDEAPSFVSSGTPYLTVSQRELNPNYAPMDLPDSIQPLEL